MELTSLNSHLTARELFIVAHGLRGLDSWEVVAATGYEIEEVNAAFIKLQGLIDTGRFALKEAKA